MTEFVICLPIFVLVFMGVVQLGLSSADSVQVFAKAHRDTMEQAIDVSRTPVTPHVNPVSSGQSASRQMALVDRPPGQTERHRQRVEGIESYSYQSMSSKGTLGESGARISTASRAANVGPLDPFVSRTPVQVIGSSRYAAIMVDETGAPPFPVNNLNAALPNLSGPRTSIAAGNRFGTVYGESTGSRSVAGVEFEYRAVFSSLVPPFPMGPISEPVSTQISEASLYQVGPYRNLLGIYMDQPYISVSSTAPVYPQ